MASNSYCTLDIKEGFVFTSRNSRVVRVDQLRVVLLLETIFSLRKYRVLMVC